MTTSADPLQAVLILVAYHPALVEVERLRCCLASLPPQIRYVVVANDFRPGEPVEALEAGALFLLRNAHNPGYGRAVNHAVAELARAGPLPPFLGALNTDLTWKSGCFETLLNWLERHADVVLAVPQLLNPAGEVQHLCKQHPTMLGLFSRRFLPDALKPRFLRRYDRWYVLADHDYGQVFDVPYLSGCCMLMRTSAFEEANRFDEDFFLYLEDADLSRAMGAIGRTVHLPVASVIHHWGRGNHRSKRLTLVNVHSAWVYFRKWGLALW